MAADMEATMQETMVETMAETSHIIPLHRRLRTMDIVVTTTRVLDVVVIIKIVGHTKVVEAAMAGVEGKPGNRSMRFTRYFGAEMGHNPLCRWYVNDMLL
jgi:hypothetical protein